MKKLYWIAFLILLVINFSCENDLVEPIDIFATEDLTNPVSLGNDAELNNLMVNADRIIETPEGYHIKGTIFSKSLSGTIPVTSGDFMLKTNLQASSLKKGFGGIDFKGYGTAAFPAPGMFSMTEIEEIPGSEVYYNTGKIFKDEAGIEHLPLIPDKYYFRYRLDKAGNGKEYHMKKITVKLREFYLDPLDPATLFTGDIYSEKAGVKRLIVEKAAVGISANELWDFVPYRYSENLEKVTGGTGFERMNGGISLAGIIPVKKYPLEILGQAVINTSYSSGGPFDFFERGFDDASFRIGVNGDLFFTQELVKFLTNVDTVRLGKATLQAEFSDDDFSMRMAGEYSDNVLDRFFGETMMQFIPFNAGEGVMYLRCSKDPDDLIIYIEEKVSLNIPGLGTTPLSNSTFKVTKDEAGLSGTVTLPYGIGDVNVSGLLRNDGTFILKGLADCNVDLGSGLVYNAVLDVEVTDKGVKLTGAMSLPYGIGNVEVTGGILSDELYFSGAIASSVTFPVDASVNSNLQLTISSKTGIRLSGNLDLPGGIGTVNVSGVINTRELLLTGTVGSGISINFGNVDVRTNTAMSFTASSLSGVVMTGAVSLPFSLGNATASVRVISSGLYLTGNLGSSIYISPYPVFNASMTMSASTQSGLYLSGRMRFPGNFGWISISGYVRNNGYNLSGDISFSSIDFGIVSLSTGFSVSITNYSGIDFSGSGRGCVNLVVDEVCATVGVRADIDYNNNSVELCMNFPVPGGDVCIGW